MDAVNLEEQAIRQQLFIRLYQKVFPAVARYVSKRGGSFDEAKDVFQDALLDYYEKSRQKDATGISSSEGAYIYGTARYLWIKRYKENQQTSALNDDTDIIRAQDNTKIAEDKLLNFLSTTGKRCMELLRSYYYDHLPMTRVAQIFGFSGVRSATVQKYKCIEKVRESVKQKALTYEDFLE